jgi:hypothetical protein
MMKKLEQPPALVSFEETPMQGQLPTGPSVPTNEEQLGVEGGEQRWVEFRFVGNIYPLRPRDRSLIERHSYIYFQPSSCID